VTAVRRILPVLFERLTVGALGFLGASGFGGCSSSLAFGAGRERKRNSALFWQWDGVVLPRDNSFDTPLSDGELACSTPGNVLIASVQAGSILASCCGCTVGDNPTTATVRGAVLGAELFGGAACVRHGCGAGEAAEVAAARVAAAGALAAPSAGDATVDACDVSGAADATGASPGDAAAAEDTRGAVLTLAGIVG